MRDPSRVISGRPATPSPTSTDLVDLTLLVAEELPCWWSNHMPYQHKTFNYFADRADDASPLLCRAGPYQTRWMLMDEHTGTHLDAPRTSSPRRGPGCRTRGSWGGSRSTRCRSRSSPARPR